MFGGLKKLASNVGKTVAKAAKDTGNAVAKGAKDTGKATVKAAVDTGHVTGKVVTSKVGQAVIGGALAVSGVGLPAAAAIGAATKGVGNAIKPGGNLKSAVTGAGQGALLGAGAASVGSVVRTVKAGDGLGGFGSRLLGGKGAVRGEQVGPPQAQIEPEIAQENAIVPGVTDSGEVKHDETDRLRPIVGPGTVPERRPKGTPTDLMTPIRRKLLGSGLPSRTPEDDVSPVVRKMSADYPDDPGLRYRGNGGEVENAATPLPDASAAAAKPDTLKDNLPMLLAVAVAGVVMVAVLGRQVRK